jgi:predicted membrane protein
MTDWDKDSLRDSIGNSVRQRIDERLKARRPSCGLSSGIVWGAALCVVGGVVLLDHLGVVSIGRLWRFWPMIFVLAGIVDLTHPGKRVWGGLLVLGGVLVQLDTLDIIRLHWVDLWPVVIIAAGLMMIWGSIEARRIRPASPGTEQSSMNLTAVFGGAERRITAHDFRYARVSAVFGGVELDFRDADIDGAEAVIEINAVFGGAELRVPEAWRVEARNQTLFGGYSDKTRIATVSTDATASTGKKTLLITGSVLFGGVEVKN